MLVVAWAWLWDPVIGRSPVAFVEYRGTEPTEGTTERSCLRLSGRWIGRSPLGLLGNVSLHMRGTELNCLWLFPGGGLRLWGHGGAWLVSWASYGRTPLYLLRVNPVACSLLWGCSSVTRGATRGQHFLLLLSTVLVQRYLKLKLTGVPRGGTGTPCRATSCWTLLLAACRCCRMRVAIRGAGGRWDGNHGLVPVSIVL